jgi:nucleoside-diphosphate-sugar epimerase
MSLCLVTGATGFVGRHLVARLVEEGIPVRCAVRDPIAARALLGNDVDIVAVGPIESRPDCGRALAGVQTIFHLAGRAHILEETSADPLAEFLRVNADGAAHLARQAAAAGVRRFVFASSIKVFGESSGERPFRPEDAPAPVDPYGVSKQRAEEMLRGIASESGMEVVIVRPPLVYGPGVGANFLRLLRLVDRGVPLPLGGIPNRRSLVSVWNLCDLFVRCSRASAAANRTILVSDGKDLSTPGLIRELARALGRPARLINVPQGLIRLAAQATGNMAEFTRLCASLTLDIDETVRILDWRPPVSVEESLARTVAAYRESVNRG